MDARKKPVKLQVNNSGAWKDVVRFDAADAHAAGEVMGAAETLGRIDGGKTTFRIVMENSLSTSLYRWSSQNGWQEVRHA